MMPLGKFRFIRLRERMMYTLLSENVFVWVELKKGIKLKALCLDNGSQYTSHKFGDFCQSREQIDILNMNARKSIRFFYYKNILIYFDIQDFISSCHQNPCLLLLLLGPSSRSHYAIITDTPTMNLDGAWMMGLRVWKLRSQERHQCMKIGMKKETRWNEMRILR